MCLQFIYVLFLYMWQRPMGLLALLDEESRFPRATDLSLAGKMYRNDSRVPIASCYLHRHAYINIINGVLLLLKSSKVSWKLQDLTILQ